MLRVELQPSYESIKRRTKSPKMEVSNSQFYLREKVFCWCPPLKFKLLPGSFDRRHYGSSSFLKVAHTEGFASPKNLTFKTPLVFTAFANLRVEISTLKITPPVRRLKVCGAVRMAGGDGACSAPPFLLLSDSGGLEFTASSNSTLHFFFWMWQGRGTY